MTNLEVIQHMTVSEMVNFMDKVEGCEIDYSKTFCDICDDRDDPNCTMSCMEWWLGIDAEKHPQGLLYWEMKHNEQRN